MGLSSVSPVSRFTHRLSRRTRGGWYLFYAYVHECDNKVHKELSQNKSLDFRLQNALNQSLRKRK